MSPHDSERSCQCHYGKTLISEAREQRGLGEMIGENVGKYWQAITTLGYDSTVVFFD